jgi:hypothetical protein
MHPNTSSFLGASALQSQHKDNKDKFVNNSPSSGTFKRTSSSSVSSSSSSPSSSTSSDNDEDASSSELVPISALHKQRPAMKSSEVKSHLQKGGDNGATKKRSVDPLSPSAIVAPKPKIRLSLKLPVSKQGATKQMPTSSTAASSGKALSLTKPKTVRNKGPTFATVATVVPSVASSKPKLKLVDKKVSLDNVPLSVDTPKPTVQKKRKGEGVKENDTNIDVAEQKPSGIKRKKAGSPKGTSGTRRSATSSSPSQPVLEGDTSQLQPQQQQQVAVMKPQYLFTGGMDIPSMKLSLLSPGLVIHPSMAMSNSSTTSNASSSAAAYRQQVASSAAPTSLSSSAVIGSAVGGGGVTSSSALSTHALHSEKISAASIFTNSMKNSGYFFPSFSSSESSPEATPQVEVELTHRGSSTVRSVQDIFDRWIPGKEAKLLLPKAFYLPASHIAESTSPDNITAETAEPSILERFLKSFSSCVQEVHNKHRVDRKTLNSYIPHSFESMLPVSLNIEHSEEYISKYQQYVRDVQNREQCISSYQKQYNEYQYAKDKIEDRKRQQAKEIKNEDNEVRDGVEVAEAPAEPEYIEIPPIPKPPTVDQEDILLPPIHLVRHLDYPSFFQSKTSPYFGLMSNNIVDPQYVGANAPGLLGLIHLLSGNVQDGTFYSAVPSYASGGPGSSKEKGAQLVPAIGKGKKMKGKRGKSVESSGVKEEEEKVDASSSIAIAADGANT